MKSRRVRQGSWNSQDAGGNELRRHVGISVVMGVCRKAGIMPAITIWYLRAELYNDSEAELCMAALAEHMFVNLPHLF